MPALSIFMRDNDPSDDSSLPESLLSEPEQALLGQSNPFGPRPKLAELRLGGLDDEKIPESVLNLPDIASFEEPSAPGQPMSWGSRVYWAALAFGALFALWLILGAPQKREAPPNEAPAWDGAGQEGETAASVGIHGPGEEIKYRFEGNSNTAAAVESSTSETMTRENPQPPTQPAPGPGSNPSMFPQAPLGQPSSVPAARNSEYPATPSAEIRTARGGAARWDGSPSGVKPSEAAPLGISTPVSP